MDSTLMMTVGLSKVGWMDIEMDQQTVEQTMDVTFFLQILDGMAIRKGRWINPRICSLRNA